MAKNYVFKAFDAKGNEINLNFGNVFYGISEEMAKGIRTGLEMGLLKKYRNVSITFREATEEELEEDKASVRKAFGI